MMVNNLRLLLLIQLWAFASSSYPSKNPGGSSSSGGGLYSSPDISLYAFQQPRPCHYSTVGFGSPNSLEDLLAHAKQFVNNPDTKMYPVSVRNGERFRDVLHLATKSGAELWGVANATGLFLGLDPHFAGLSRLKMELIKKEWCERNSVGIFGGVAYPDQQEPQPQDDNSLGNSYDDDDGDVYRSLPVELEFSCPTYPLWGKDLDIPTICTVQVAAFAHDIKVFASLQEFTKYADGVRAEGNIPFPVHCFFRMDIFDELHGKEKEATDKKKRSMAVMTGHVLKSDIKINEQTGDYFYWALVETLGGCRLDVVIHPQLIEGDNQSPPRPGTIIMGAFWLTGRLLNED